MASVEGTEEGRASQKRPRHELNSRMHPANKYKDSPPDFDQLAAKYPDFAKHVKRTGSASTINFKDMAALRELTYALLKEDYGLDLDIPLSTLIPTVTSRANYVHFIEDLMAMAHGAKPSGPSVRGLDIGTGYSCIYPLLGCKMNDWTFVATDITMHTSHVDAAAVERARANVNHNHMTGLIEVCLVSDTDPVLLPTVGGNSKFDFCMCNPPFFQSTEDQQQTLARSHLPFSAQASHATRSETVTEGGEVAFVRRIISDSVQLRDRVTWYTSMVGKKSSLIPLLAELRKLKVSNVRTTELCQGRTMRWALAWSFTTIGEDDLPPISKRYRVAKDEDTGPRAKEKLIHVAGVRSLDALKQEIVSILDWYQIGHTHTSHVLHTMHWCAHQHTWSRRARRERQKQLQAEAEGTLPPPAETPTESKAAIFEADVQLIGSDEQGGEEGEEGGGDVYISITHTEGDTEQLQAFELHFARGLLEKGFVLPDLQDLGHARSLDEAGKEKREAERKEVKEGRGAAERGRGRGRAGGRGGGPGRGS